MVWICRIHLIGHGPRRTRYGDSLTGREVNPMLTSQYTLLTEILKKAGFPSSYLVRMIKEYGITPSWEHIPLPQGIIVQLPAKEGKKGMRKRKALQININLALTPRSRSFTQLLQNCLSQYGSAACAPSTSSGTVSTAIRYHRPASPNGP